MTTGHCRLAPFMWGAIASAAAILITGVVLRLDGRIAGYAVGLLVLACLASCGLALWLDRRAARDTAGLAGRIPAPPPR